MYVLLCVHNVHAYMLCVYYYDDGHHFYIPEILQNKVPPTEALRWVGGHWSQWDDWSDIGDCTQSVAYYTWYLNT